MDIRIRRFFLICAAFCFIGAFPVAAQADDGGYKDVKVTHWAYESVAWADENGIVDGYPDGTFQPDQPVRQMEFMAMLLRAFKPSDFDEEAGKDILWSAPYSNYMSEMNWRFVDETERGKGHEDNKGSFASRGYVAQLVAAANGRHYNLTDAILYVIDSGFSEGKTAASVEGYMTNDTLTRAEAVTFVRRLTEKMTMLYPSPRQETKYDPGTWQQSPAESMPLQVQIPPGDPLFRYSHVGFDQPQTGYALVSKPMYTVTGTVYEAYGESLTVRVDEVGTSGFSPVDTSEALMKDGTFHTELNLPTAGLYRVTVESVSHVVHRQGTALIAWFYLEYRPEPNK